MFLTVVMENVGWGDAMKGSKGGKTGVVLRMIPSNMVWMMSDLIRSYLIGRGCSPCLL